MNRTLVVVAAVMATTCGRGAPKSTEHAPAAPAASERLVTVPPDSPMLSELRCEEVHTRELPTGEVVATGKIEANPNRVSKVVLPVTGRILSVAVRSGDAVAKDQPLLTIQSPDADAAASAYLSADAALAQAQAVLLKVQADYDRAADLFEHHAVARKEVISAESLLVQAKAGHEQGRAGREQALRRLTMLGLTPGHFDQPVVVRAPLSGKVLDLSVVPGEFRNDTNAVLMTIADLSTVWVTSQVPESAIRFVRVGERVEIELLAFPGEHFDGRVSRIGDIVDPQSRTIRVQAELANPQGRFRPEMYGSIRHVEATSIVPVVPTGAVVMNGATSVVFVETSPGRFERREVTVGKATGDVVPVVHGLKAGEEVVVDGAMLLQGLLRHA